MADRSTGTCSCGSKPVVARGLCRRCYGRWWLAQQDVEKRRAAWREGYYRHRDKILAQQAAKKTMSCPCIDCGATVEREHLRGSVPQRCPACTKEHDRERARRRGTARCYCATTSTCQICDIEFRLPATRRRGKIASYCPTCRLLVNRQRRHVRRAKERAGGVPEEVLLTLIRKRKCGMCGCIMTRKSGPRQVNIDHIVPLNVGGQHVPENLRAVCRTCNFKRPKDGSDIDQLLLGCPSSAGEEAEG